MVSGSPNRGRATNCCLERRESLSTSPSSWTFACSSKAGCASTSFGTSSTAPDSCGSTTGVRGLRIGCTSANVLLFLECRTEPAVQHGNGKGGMIGCAPSNPAVAASPIAYWQTGACKHVRASFGCPQPCRIQHAGACGFWLGSIAAEHGTRTAAPGRACAPSRRRPAGRAGCAAAAAAAKWPRPGICRAVIELRH